MRQSRWRTWLRVHTPTTLYRRGLVIPKVADCGHHEWYNRDDRTEGCYHCEAKRPRTSATGG